VGCLPHGPQSLVGSAAPGYGTMPTARSGPKSLDLSATAVAKKGIKYCPLTKLIRYSNFSVQCFLSMTVLFSSSVHFRDRCAIRTPFSARGHHLTGALYALNRI